MTAMKIKMDVFIPMKTAMMLAMTMEITIAITYSLPQPNHWHPVPFLVVIP